MKPVVLIFAREINGPLTSLVKKLDAEMGKNKAAKMRSCVVFLSDEETLEKELQDFAKEAGLKNVSLGIDNPAGPKAWKIAKEAEVTVVLYTKGKIMANHTFRAGELNDAAIEKVLTDVPRLVAKK